MNKKYFVALVILALVCLGFIVYLEIGNLGKYNPFAEMGSSTAPVVACMEEAMQCPDGSYVSRVGPNCDFEACPNTSGVIPDSVACTMEAKQCPDGSYVGRSGPNCEFALCPNVAEKNCPQLSPASPDFCLNGKIESGGIDADGCQLPPKCVVQN